MTEYDVFSRFYDAVMDDPGPRADRVIEWIEQHRPHATRLLELGCGTGSILARLDSIPELTGIDRSAAMLARARTKVPRARLIEGDMRSFSLEERFDVVVCVFDSLNHLLFFGDWESMFDAVHRHLVDGGLFIFDVNTVGELRRLGQEPPWVDDFDGGVAIIDVSFAEDGESEGISVWDVRLFEQTGAVQYTLHRERIGELAVHLSRMKAALRANFELVEERSERGDQPSDDSVKGHFVYRRRP
ncbi:MAG TPA: class I SAM-dependent methyltransferase [Acidimicrobiales bacterium]|nr:class I SAM-dependent methyltransferase [Acidimicrobiales bacterium]